MTTDIGLDYDFRDKSFIRKILYSIVLKYNPRDIKLSISPSGRGYHIKFVSMNTYSDEEKLDIRKDLKDDPGRISEVEGIYRDVLFDAKVVDGEFCRCKELDVDKMIILGEEVEI